MLDIAFRGLSLVLALGFLLGSVWGGSIQFDYIAVAISLAALTFLPRSKRSQLWALLIFAVGLCCLVLGAYRLLRTTEDFAEMAVQLVVFAIPAGLLIATLLREGKEKARVIGLP